MKRILLLSVTVFTLLCPTFAIAGSANAVNIFNDACSGNAGTTTACQSVREQNNHGSNPIIEIIRIAIQILSYIIGLAAIISLIVNGFRLITSSGDSNAAASARGGIISALIGIAVAALALAIVLLVLGK